MMFLESAGATPLILHVHSCRPAEYDFYSHLSEMMCLLMNKVKEFCKSLSFIQTLRTNT